MRTLRFDYKINNVGDMHFNYNIDVNITSILGNIYKEWAT